MVRWEKLVIVCLVVSLASLGVGCVFLKPARNDASGGEEWRVVIKTYGEIPEFEDEVDRIAWFNKLHEVHSSVRGTLEPLMVSHGGPIFAYGTDLYTGYFVAFKKGEVYDDALIEEIYKVISDMAEEVGIEGVPVSFEVWDVILVYEGNWGHVERCVLYPSGTLVYVEYTCEDEIIGYGENGDPILCEVDDSIVILDRAVTRGVTLIGVDGTLVVVAATTRIQVTAAE